MSRRRSNSPGPALDVQRLVDLMVFAPIGLGTAIVEDGPDALRRARQELSNARFVGRFAVDRSVAELRRRIDDSAAPSVPTDVVDVEPAEVSDASDAKTDGEVPDVAELALPDYETLPAIDIVDKLEHLSSGERAAIRRYEEANRQRRTVLGKLARLGDS